MLSNYLDSLCSMRTDTLFILFCSIFLQLDILQQCFHHSENKICIGQERPTQHGFFHIEELSVNATNPALHLYLNFTGSMCEKGLRLRAGGLVEQSAAPTHYSEVCPQWAVALRRSRQILSYCCCCCLEKKQRRHHSHQSPQ